MVSVLSRAAAMMHGSHSTEASRQENGRHVQAEAHQHDEPVHGNRKQVRLAGGRKAIGAFLLSLLAFTIQTEAAQYVQQALGYRKPFFSLFLGHSSFLLLFPLYMGVLRLVRPGVPLSHHLHLISQNLHWQLRAPTKSLPEPRADSVRRRLSTLSMRTEATLSEVDANDFDIEELERRAQVQGPPVLGTWSEKRFGFDVVRLLGVFAVLTAGLTVPALSWYSAVPLTSMADITTIYNTYAVWALVFSIWFLGEQWERRKVFSVLLACGGVVLVAYGGAEHRRRPKEPLTPEASIHAAHLARRTATSLLRWQRDKISKASNGNAFLGDMLAFFGAVTMAAYEMAFKIIGTLPDEETQRERYRGGGARNRSYANMDAEEVVNEDEVDSLLRRPQQNEDEDEVNDQEDAKQAEQQAHDDIEEEDRADVEQDKEREQRSTERTAIWRALDADGRLSRTASPSYQSMTPPVQAEDSPDEQTGKRISIRAASEEAANRRRGSTRAHKKPAEDWIPPPLPFGLHPIIVTSGIGLVTFTVLWIGLPIANVLGWEPFEMPPNLETYAYLFVVAFTGIIFNGCFSILLALWGPVLASVSCLLTTVLVFLADILLGHDFKWISLLGCVSIIAGFGVLVSSGETESH